MNYTKIHIGKLIQQFVKQNNIRSADLARQTGKTRQNIYDLYKRDDVEVKLLLTLCDVLQHNFIEDIYPANKKTADIDTVFNTMKLLVAEKLKENE
ncbi:MAG: helix-turn-helix transcriptional regulator [Prevotellaceae bacterium]|jgi:DNA-binding Xre family transcriptional regulator|nr:helix-turn-helix transcriptional regulator [Prevotellaceae bacterium]